MKKGWQSKRIGDVCDLATGGTPRRSNSAYFGGDIKWLVSGDIHQGEIYDCEGRVTAAGMKNSNAKLLPTNSVMIALNGQGKTRGTVALLRVPATCNQSLVCMTPKVSSGLMPEFLYANLNARYDELRHLTSDDDKDRRGLNMGIIRNIEVPIAPLDEQQHIVDMLDEAFVNLTTAKKNTEKNLENADALFESYLQSVLGDAGDDWQEKGLSDVCAITSSLVDPRKNEFYNLMHVGAGNIDSKTGVLTALKTAKEEALISGKFLFDETMVLYSKIRPYLMKVARPNFLGVCSADVYPLAPLPDQITRDYLFYLLLSKGFTDYAIQGSARAGMPKVNRTHLFNFKMRLPSLKKQKEIAKNLDEVREECQRLAAIYDRKIGAVEGLKKSLLDEAFR